MGILYKCLLCDLVIFKIALSLKTVAIGKEKPLYMNINTII